MSTLQVHKDNPYPGVLTNPYILAWEHRKYTQANKKKRNELRESCENSPLATDEGVLLLRAVRPTAEAFCHCSTPRSSLRLVELTAHGLFLQSLHPENRLSSVLLSRNSK